MSERTIDARTPATTRAADLQDFPRHAPERAAAYRAAGAWLPHTIIQQWQQVADRRSDASAVVAPDGRLTYAQLSVQTDRIATGLLDLGLEPGEAVLMQVTNRLGAALAWYGVLKAGLVPVCTLPAHRHHEILEIGLRAGAAAHVVDAAVSNFDMLTFAGEVAAELPGLRVTLSTGAPQGSPGVRLEDLAQTGDAVAARARVQEVQAALDPEGLAVLQLSGGTTGTPKLIPRLHHEYWHNARRYAEVQGWDADVVTAHVIPILHNAGVIMGLHGPHSVGGTAVLLPPVLEVVLPALVAEGVTDVLLGALFDEWTRPLTGRSTRLRRVVLSGNKPAEGQVESFEAAGVWTGQVYGMAEGFFCTTPPGAPLQVRRMSVGVPLDPQDEIRLLDPDSEQPVPDGQVGEVCVRGPYTIAGYLGTPEHNQVAFTTDGFYRTGDLGLARVEDGSRCYSIEGRIKDVIDRGGEKVNVEEVEALLAGMPQVTAVALVAMPDVRLGQRGCAYVVPVNGHDVSLQAVHEHLTVRRVAKFKWPERVELLDALPKTPVGKVDKKLLRHDIAAKLRVVSA